MEKVNTDKLRSIDRIRPSIRFTGTYIYQKIPPGGDRFFMGD